MLRRIFYSPCASRNQQWRVECIYRGQYTRRTYSSSIDVTEEDVLGDEDVLKAIQEPYNSLHCKNDGKFVFFLHH